MREPRRCHQAVKLSGCDGSYGWGFRDEPNGRRRRRTGGSAGARRTRERGRMSGCGDRAQPWPCTGRGASGARGGQPRSVVGQGRSAALAVGDALFVWTCAVPGGGGNGVDDGAVPLGPRGSPRRRVHGRRPRFPEGPARTRRLLASRSRTALRPARGEPLDPCDLRTQPCESLRGNGRGRQLGLRFHATMVAADPGLADSVRCAGRGRESGGSAAGAAGRASGGFPEEPARSRTAGCGRGVAVAQFQFSPAADPRAVSGGGPSVRARPA